MEVHLIKSGWSLQCNLSIFHTFYVVLALYSIKVLTFSCNLKPFTSTAEELYGYCGSFHTYSLGFSGPTKLDPKISFLVLALESEPAARICVQWVEMHLLTSERARCFCISRHSSCYCCHKWPRQNAIPCLRDEVVFLLSWDVFSSTLWDFHQSGTVQLDLCLI